MDLNHSDDPGGPPEPPATRWPRRQAYFVTVEWLDEPHEPESPERLAQVLRHAIEHGHTTAPDTPPARFTVRVKAEDVTSEVTGTVVHHHHHHA